jgi:hypothetical protein
MSESAEKHFVAYHNVDERGRHLAATKDGRGCFETNKSKLPNKGDVVCTENLIRVDDVMESPKLAG